jgi:hypothetical protein
MPKHWTSVQCPHCDAADSMEFVKIDPWLVTEAVCKSCAKTVHIEKERFLRDYVPKSRAH